MARIQYVGPMHSREFSAADFKSLGVEGEKKTAFTRKEATEVSDAVHKALLEKLPREFADAGEIEPLDENSKKAAEEQAERDLTAAQQEKAARAGKKAAKAAKDAETATVTEEQEAETDARPQTTEDTGPTGSSTANSPTS